ncbi:MAG: asparagine--tRNA ligase, partial [Clostridia bacterium]|nr:asparagine--tRNA ligase [Clostridia bacterium]
MKHIDISAILGGKDYLGQTVTVCGWVRTARDSKNMAFLALNDGTSLPHLQIVIDKASGVDLPAEAGKLGAALKVEGVVVENMNNGTPEINATAITVLGAC